LIDIRSNIAVLVSSCFATMLIYLVIYLLSLCPIVSPLFASNARTFKKQSLSISRHPYTYMSINKDIDIDIDIDDYTITGRRTSLLVNNSPSSSLLEFIQHSASSLKRGVSLNEVTDRQDTIEVLFADRFQQMDNTGKQQVLSTYRYVMPSILSLL